ncbi:Retrotransposable element Tf2 protein type 3-like protein, partial [Leptotrombidium deliense]
MSGYGSKKQYIHVAIDNFTRYLWTLSSKTQTAKDFINLVKQISQTNKPKLIIADRYTGINSTEFKNYLEKQSIKIQFITVNCPQSNGMCERMNQTLVTRLRCKINEQCRNVCWPKLLIDVTEEYNNSPHSVTTLSPKYLMFRIEPFAPITDKYYPEMKEARRIAFEKSSANHALNKKYYDDKHEDYEFKIGELVYVENKNEIS